MTMRLSTQSNARAADKLELGVSCALDCCSEASDDSSQDSVGSLDFCGDDVLEHEFERENAGQQQQHQAVLPANVEDVALPVPQRPAVPRPESAASCPRLAFRVARKAKEVLSKPAPPLELLSLAGSAGAALRSLRQA